MNNENRIEERKKKAEAMMNLLGVSGYAELVQCSLLIHINFEEENDCDELMSVLVKPTSMALYDHSIDFLFENSPIELAIQAFPTGHLAPELKELKGYEETVIVFASFGEDGCWTAGVHSLTVKSKGCVGEIKKQLSVELIKPA